MANLINISKGTTGLNNVVDPVRLAFNQDSGISDLSKAVNIKIDDSGGISRRDGSTQLLSGDFHSLFCDEGDCFVIKEGALYQVGTDMSIRGIRSGISDNRMSFCQVNEETYYTNKIEKGVIHDGISHSWVKKEYVGPTTNKTFVGPPIGSHLEYYRGRIYIAEGRVLWYSEPYSFSMFDQARGYIQFDSNIIMVKAVEGGIFVSTNKFTYFLSGKIPSEFTQTMVTTYPAIEWSCSVSLVDAIQMGYDNPGLCAVWASSKGVVLGMQDGIAINLTQKNIIYPEGSSSGAGIIMGFNYIHTMN